AVDQRLPFGLLDLSGQAHVAALHGVHHVEDAMGARSEYKAPPGGHSH
ncbi:transporter, partial [Burkholderia cenocepacia]|nr:transporter [Burkholderia cenocepacia]